jgi:CAAX protease family protein
MIKEQQKTEVEANIPDPSRSSDGNSENLSKWLNLSFAVTMIIVFLVYILPRFFAKTPFDPRTITTDQLIIMLFSTPILFFIILFPITIFIAPQIKALNKLKLQHGKLYYIPIAIGAALAAYLGCAFINAGSNLVIKLLDIKIEPPLVPLLAKECTDTGFILFAFAVIIVAPLVEEIVFRRIIFSWLTQYTSKWIAIILTAALFAIVHDSYAQFAALFMLGIGFQLIYLKFNSLIPAIIMHAGFNSISAILLLLIRIGILPEA